MDSSVLFNYVFPSIAAIAVLLVPGVKRIVQYVGTLFHEFGHAIISLLTGGGAHSIRIHADTSGVTGTSHQRSAGGLLSRVLTTLAGYSTPVNLGLALLITSLVGWSDVGFWFLVGVSILVLLLTRNLFGFLVTIGFSGLMAVFFLTSFVTHEQVVFFFGAVLLLLGLKDIRQIVPYAWNVHHPEENLSDFHLLAQGVGLSPRFWVVIFFIVEVFLLFLATFAIITFW